ncbi:hypothetical protein J0X19_15210 [Hymenobacter sp. BT186]|uniref:Uncharacterized protein n=1 Tax=Hymenobacter telluris TaxID=2816474 RepID=A0A939EXH6_9BACT|nr:hypothetical protein [Hymenobacter telluris]MBO0359310.1 hypothetical protein [Hymenobacter telluris]MBW3375336.1 hypothetical protein [Hymenobacter norwichensis]
MQIVKEYPFKSGYQPRPTTPPGRALSVLVAVCAVLWVWWMVPYFWPQLDTYGVNSLFNWLEVALPLSNGIVLWWVTRPMWKSPQLDTRQELKRSFVLLLSVLFHLASFALVVGVILVFGGTAVEAVDAIR